MQRLLSENETSEVLSVLKGNLDKNFESVTLAFGLLFKRETDKFRACCGLVIALSERAFLDPRQRLFALYALLEIHSHRAPDIHPFWEFLLEQAVTPEAPTEETELIHLFLVQKRGFELSRRNLKDYLAAVYSIPAVVLQSHATELHRLKSIKKDGSHGLMSVSGDLGVVLDGNGVESVPREHQTALFEIWMQNVGMVGWRSTVRRPLPPPATGLSREGRWVSTGCRLGLMWDTGRPPEAKEALQRLKDRMKEAQSMPLSPQKQKQMLQDIEHHPSVLSQCGLDDRSFPLLVENASSVAAAVLQRVMSIPLGDELLQSLTQMSTSLHSMEVVNTLANAIPLPSHFVDAYISNCIFSCNAIEDHYMQSRLVRLLCVFLQSLIKSEVIDLSRLIHEVQAFCITHSRIREAVSLFRLLKKMENDDEGSSQ